MAASKELITKIVIKGQVDSSLTKAFSAVAKNSETSLNKLANYGKTLSNVFKVAAVGIGTAAVTAANSAIEFESAFAGVKKTVDETDTTSYDDLALGIRKLATETPAAATEIAAVAEAAGQLGIKADDILSFSKVMIDLGESTNLTSDEAATSIAKLFNVTGTSMSKVQNFGSTLVALGNNAATTESDILAMSTRIAGSGKQIGLTEQQILALATSLSSVGIEAEMGGSAISTTMTQIDKDVALQSENLAIWAKTAGMSASQFSAAWDKDAYGTLQKVLQGMADTKAEGGNLNVLLEDLGINGIRQGDMLKRLSSATGLMGEMTTLANKAWEENSALTKEANTRYATTASRIQILKNKMNDVAITVGNAMLPVINKLIDKMDEIDWDAKAERIVSKVQWVIDNFDKIKVALGIAAGAFAAFKIGGFINTIAGAVKELKLLGQALQISTRLKNLGEAISLSKAGFPALAGQASKLGAALGAITWPVIAVIAVIALLGAAFASLWKNNDEFRNKMTSIWNQIKETVSGFCDGLVERINSLGFNFSSITEVLSSIWKGFCDLVAPLFEGAFQNIQIVLSTVLDTILGVVDFFIALFKGDWEGCWTAIQNIFETVWTGIVSWFENIGNTLKGIADVVLGWFGTNWNDCWSAIKEFFVNTWDSISSFFTTTIPNVFNSVVNFFAELPGKIWGWLQNTWSKVVAWGASLWTTSKETGSNFVSGIVTFFQQLPGKIGAWLSGVWQKITSWGANLWAKAKEIGSNFVNSIVNFFSQLPYKIGYAIGYIIGTIASWGVKLWNFATVTIPQFVGKVVEWFAQLPGRIWTWLQSAWQKVVTWGTNLWNKAKEIGAKVVTSIVTFISQLPGKIWTWLQNAWTKFTTWGANLWAKAKDIGSKVINAVVTFFSQLPGKIWTWLVNAANKVATWGTNIYNKAKSAVSKMISTVVTFFSQLPGKIWTWLVNAAQKVVSWGTQLVSKGKKAATDLFNAIVNKVKEIPGKMLEIGKNIVEGLWNGLKNAKDWLIGKIKSFGKGITDGIADAFGCASPSTITTKTGLFTGQGLGVGFDKSKKFVEKKANSLRNVALNAIGTISPTVSGVSTKLQKFGTGGTVTTPRVAVVGDSPETIVPHGNTPRNRSLLAEAARGVGAASGGGNVFTFTFAPVISGGNAEANRAMIREEEEEFERKMDAWIAKHRRLAFNGV